MLRTVSPRNGGKWCETQLDGIMMSLTLCYCVDWVEIVDIE